MGRNFVQRAALFRLAFRLLSHVEIAIRQAGNR